MTFKELKWLKAVYDNRDIKKLPKLGKYDLATIRYIMDDYAELQFAYDLIELIEINLKKGKKIWWTIFEAGSSCPEIYVWFGTKKDPYVSDNFSMFMLGSEIKELLTNEVSKNRFVSEQCASWKESDFND